MYTSKKILTTCRDSHILYENHTYSLTLYDPGGGALKAPPPLPIFCTDAFNFGAALLSVGDFSQKIV